MVYMEKKSSTYGKIVCSVIFWWNVPKMSVGFICSTVCLNSNVDLVNFCLNDLFFTKKEMLELHSITELESICWDWILFSVYIWAGWHWHVYILLFYLLLILSFHHNRCLSVCSYNFWLQDCFAWSENSYSYSFLFSILLM